MRILHALLCGCPKPKLLTTKQEYNAKLFVADALAGITVAMVALPLNIAIAIASGAAPAAGLVTAIVGGLLISALGGEPHRWREHLCARPADRFLLFLTMFLTLVSDLTVAIAVGTMVGLAQRLIRRDVEPAEWTPLDR